MGEAVQLPIDFQKQPQASVLSDKKTAGIVGLHQLNKTNLSEADVDLSTRLEAAQGAEALQPLIRTTSFENFMAPRIKYTHGFEKDGACILEEPPTRSMYLCSSSAHPGTREYVMAE
jgi:hypothetical protein